MVRRAKPKAAPQLFVPSLANVSTLAERRGHDRWPGGRKLGQMTVVSTFTYVSVVRAGCLVSTRGARVTRFGTVGDKYIIEIPAAGSRPLSPIVCREALGAFFPSEQTGGAETLG